MSVLTCLHDLATAHAQQPGAVLWARLRDELHHELTRDRDTRAATDASPVDGATVANDLGVGVRLDSKMIDAAIVASYAHAKPASANAKRTRDNERAQITAALAAALATGGFVVEVDDAPPPAAPVSTPPAAPVSTP